MVLVLEHHHEVSLVASKRDFIIEGKSTSKINSIIISPLVSIAFDRLRQSTPKDRLVYCF